MNFTFELADITHANEISDAEKICFPNDFWSFDSIKNELNNSRNICILARNRDELMGYIFLSTVCDECELNRIAVIPEYRNKKIAESLIEKAKKDLRQNSFAIVFLEVRKSNQPAINLYLKTGFEKNGLRKNYYKNPTEDAVLMSLKLI